MCFLRAIRDKSALAVAQELLKLFTDVGFPRILQSDNGKEFVNTIVRHMKEECHMEHRLITAYHPRANGLSERNVRTAKQSIIKTLRGEETHWPRVLAFTQLAMNYKVADLHQSSPFSLFFGRKLNFFGSYKDAIQGTTDFKDLEERVKFLNELVYPAITESSARKQDGRKLNFDKNNKLVDIPIGTFVMTVVSVKDGKASANYEGPFKVVSRTAGGSYRLMSNDDTGILPRAYAPSQLKMIAPPEEQDVAFEVERIIDDKLDEDGIRWYLVRWKGYSSTSDSWEPSENFVDLKIIQSYWNDKTNTRRSPRLRRQ